MSQPKIEITTKPSADALAVGFFMEKPKEAKGKKKEKPLPKPLYLGKKDSKIGALTDQIRESGHFLGKKAESDFLRYYNFGDFKNVMLVGLGVEEKWDAEIARQAGAAVALQQKRQRIPTVGVHADSIFCKTSKDELDYTFQAFCEGYLTAGYRYSVVDERKPGDFDAKGLQVIGLNKSSGTDKAIKEASQLAKAINFARSLGDRPGNYLNPTQYAGIVTKMSRECGIKCTIWNKARIQKEKMGLLMGVAKGSTEEPRFMILEYNGNKKSKSHVALVGKAITFDAGGISLKPALRMEEMKYDMMGSATVAGVMNAAALLKLPINLKAYISAAENMPDGAAQKPGDVAISRSGKTVEIINTDAEGRLVMADALEYAQEKKPEAIMDFATLTGAVLVALGTYVTGIMGNNRKLIERFEDSAEVTGERVWELPLFEEFEDFMRSSVADIKNSSDIREAGSSKGGIFLKFFVQKGMPWVHCDIAGSAWYRRDVNYHPKKYASGAMIRLMIHMLKGWKPLK